MTEQDELNKVKKLLARWIAEIELDNHNKNYDINKLSEGFCEKLLNTIYNLNLKDLNRDKENHPAIDLGDKEAKIAYQITSRIDASKIKDALEKFVSNKLDKTFTKGIRFLILNKNEVKLGRTNYNKIYQGFNKELHILTVPDLNVDIAQLYNKSKENFLKVKTLLEQEFGNDKLRIDEEVLNEQLSPLRDGEGFKYQCDDDNTVLIQKLKDGKVNTLVIEHAIISKVNSINIIIKLIKKEDGRKIIKDIYENLISLIYNRYIIDMADNDLLKIKKKDIFKDFSKIANKYKELVPIDEAFLDGLLYIATSNCAIRWVVE